jgi:16S rRNA (uracil1498-N3)-methyltransferase
MPRRNQPPRVETAPVLRPPRLAVRAVAVGPLTLDLDQAHYLSRVLRLRVGHQIAVFDAAGCEGLATIQTLDRGSALVEVRALETRPTPLCAVTVALAAPKGERADWVVEKLTEVGVTGILWLTTERAVVRADGESRRTERWLRIAQAAAAQSERVGWPTIAGPIPFERFLTLSAERRLIADRSGESLQSWAQPRSALLGIGPEGGFTATELEAVARAGFMRTRLSANILRVETAAIVGASMILGLGEIAP